MTRMAIPCAILFLFFFLCVGVVSNSLEFQKFVVPSVAVPFWTASFLHYHELIANLFQMPQVCLPGNAVNDFQTHQCNQYWSYFAKSAGLGIAPFASIALFFYLGLGNLNAIYKKCQEKAEKGKAAFSGTVTHPAEAPQDIFSWFYCFRPITVELPDRTQVKVYVPDDFEMPSPGQRMAVFEAVSFWGEKRHFAVVYAPHVAVVRGA